MISPWKVIYQANNTSDTFKNYFHSLPIRSTWKESGHEPTMTISEEDLPGTKKSSTHAKNQGTTVPTSGDDAPGTQKSRTQDEIIQVQACRR